MKSIRTRLEQLENGRSGDILSEHAARLDAALKGQNNGSTLKLPTKAQLEAESDLPGMAGRLARAALRLGDYRGGSRVSTKRTEKAT